MKNKGFTLVEVLAVIVILSLLMVVAIPASQGIGNKIKDKLLDTKLTLATQAAVLWSQDNLECLTSEVCSDVLTRVSCPIGTISDFECSNIKLKTLAEAKYLEYDDEKNKIIENPKNKSENLNDYEVTIKFNLINKTATAFLSKNLIDIDVSTTPTTTKTISTTPTVPTTTVVPTTTKPVILGKLLSEAILAEYGGSSAIPTAPASLFTLRSKREENKMYKMNDDYGTSYYYRGSRSYLYNNLIFAGFQWKIVRINGNGSIKIIYNGICSSPTCGMNIASGTEMGKSPFNTRYLDAKFIGYMYGGTDRFESTSRAGAVVNETSSTVKTFLDNWYLTNIKNTAYENYLSDTLFCNDRRLISEVGGLATGPGYGNLGISTYYAPNHRTEGTMAPSLICGQKNDRFTVSDTNIGNGSLTYPIGLLNVDEAVIAGNTRDHNDDGHNTNYLWNWNSYWTLSPACHVTNGNAIAYVVSHGFPITIDIACDSRGVRGVLNLISSVRVTGMGSELNPFIVV